MAPGRFSPDGKPHMPTEINWRSTEVKSRIYNLDMERYESIGFWKFLEDYILVSTHAL